MANEMKVRSLWLEAVEAARLRGYPKDQDARDRMAAVLIARSCGVRLRHLAKAFGVSTQRISQLERRGLRKAFFKKNHLISPVYAP